MSAFALAYVCGVLAHPQLFSHADPMSSSAETGPASTASNSATKSTTAWTKAMRLAVSTVCFHVFVCSPLFLESMVALIQQDEKYPRD